MPDRNRPLTEEEIGQFRKMLTEKREELWREIIQDLKTRVSEEYQDLLNTVKDEEELAQIDLQEEVVLGVIDARKKELEAINQALWRIDHGEFGRCLECNEWIPKKRLEIRPWASYCVKCKEKLEKIGRV